ncbi:MAG TPA: DUF6079 family protein [Verrucomicrobiota bacterium]|nr:DUF6079 family protein [Verrucomicrobiota bacterium]
MRELGKIITTKPEPETTPSLTDIIQKEKAAQTVSEYLFTASLRGHFKRIFDCVINDKGQGFWVQAEYGAGKTHFLGALVDLLVWQEAKVWDQLRDDELRKDYAGAISKKKWFPVAFSLRGMGQSGDGDSLMRVFEEEIRKSIKEFAPALDAQIKVTSPELADHWYSHEATDAEKAGVRFFFEKEHKLSPEDYRSKNGPKKFGQELERSKLPQGRLRGKFKERFAYIYEQITKLGGYEGIVFVVDEFRSWQDRHPPGTAAYAEDEEVLETLAYVLPTQHLNIITIIASQGDMPQKLSGGGEGDRFVPLYLLADKNKGDFGEIVTFRSRELNKGAATDIKDYYDYCRKEYKFIKQANISLDAFTSIFPFQPRCFDVMRRITQNAEKHNLPTARSAIRMAWQTLSDGKLLKGKRLITLADIINTDELHKGLNHEHYKDAYQNLQGAIEQLPELDVGPEERDQCRAILQTLLLWVLSLPDNLRDGLTAQEVAEAAWLNDEAVGAKDHAEHLLELLVQNGFPVRRDNKSKEGKDLAVYSYELSAMQAQPSKFFSPLKKKYNADTKRQDDRWVESLFWDLTMITPEAQAELQVNGGIFAAFAPPDQRSAQERQSNHPPKFALPHRTAASTRRVHRVAYGGEVVVSDRWRDEFGEEIKHADQHFRLVYLTSKPGENDTKLTAALKDTRVAICRPEQLSADTRDALADLLAAEEMKKNCAAPNQGALRDYADGKRRDAIKAILKCQQDEFRRGKVVTQKGYGIQAVQTFATPKDREETLAGVLLDKAYDTPLFSPKELKKDFTETDARKTFAGLFSKEPASAEKDAVTNFGPGLELTIKSHPTEFKPDHSQALAKFHEALAGVPDKPVNDLKTTFCRPPYALTQEMVTLYVFALVRSGAWELALNPSAPIQLANGKPLPGNKLTAHTLGLVKWNTQLDKALLGARLFASTQKGWDEVLPFARVLDDTLKPAATPDEELLRGEQLVTILGKLKTEVPDVESGVAALATKLGGTVPKSFTELCARLKALATSESYQQFDAAVRESYADAAKFKDAYEGYTKAHKLRDKGMEIGQARDYLTAAAESSPDLKLKRDTLLGQLKFDSLFTQPHLIPARLDSFNQWKADYVQAYRKGHRAYYENLGNLAKSADALRPRTIALARLNSITELGPAFSGTANIAGDFAKLEDTLWVCPDAAEADVTGANALCPKCQWTPEKALPQAEHDRIAQAVTQGLADRLQRLKDASISTILKKADGEQGRADLKALLEIIQLANADKLAGVMTDELAAFLRQLLQEANIVQESVTLAPILQQIGAIEEDRVDEAVSKFTSLLKNAIKDAKAKHGTGKRVRVFLRMDDGKS